MFMTVRALDGVAVSLKRFEEMIHRLTGDIVPLGRRLEETETSAGEKPVAMEGARRHTFWSWKS